MPSALLLIAVSNALAIWETLPFSEPVHCGSGMPSSEAASARPVLVGTKKEFVVTWLTNTNFQSGVSGKAPAPLPPWASWTPEQAASSAPAAAAPPPAPRNLNAALREVELAASIVITTHPSRRLVSESLDDWSRQSRALRLPALPSFGEQVEVDRHAGMRGQRLVVQLDAKARLVRQRDETVHHLGKAGHTLLDEGIGEVVEVLLDLEVDHGGRQVHVGGRGDHATDVVRGHQQV